MVYGSDMYTTDKSVEKFLQIANCESTIVSITEQVLVIKITVSLWFTWTEKAFTYIILFVSYCSRCWWCKDEWIFFFLFHLFLAALGLLCCAQAFSSCGEWGLLFVAVRRGGFSCCRARALGTWASVVVARRLSSCGSWALECRLSSCGAQA